VTLFGRFRLPRLAALALLALAVGLLWLGPVEAYLDLVADGRQRLDKAEATLQRYRTAAGAAAAQPAPGAAALLFPQVPDSQAAALLQETVKSAASAAQVQIQGFQVLRSDAAAGPVRIAVQVRASGDIGGLGRFLYAIEAARPVLYPDNLHVQSRPQQAVGQTGNGGAGAAGTLDFQLDVSAFKSGPST